MEIKQLEYYLQLCQDKNFTRAAENLYITPQGLNKAVRALSEEYGVELYYRDGKKIVLSNAGKELRRHAKKIVAEYRVLKQQMKLFSSGNYENVVHVGSSFGVYRELYEKLFSKVETQFPTTNFVYHEYPDQQCKEALLNEELDLCFSAYGKKDMSNPALKIENLMSRKVVALVNRENPLSEKEDITCRDLQNEAISIADQNFQIYHSFRTRCEESNINPNITFVGGEISSVHSRAIANKSVAITVDFVAPSPAYRILPFEGGSINWSIGMMLSQNRNHAEIVKDIWDFICEEKARR